MFRLRRSLTRNAATAALMACGAGLVAAQDGNASVEPSMPEWTEDLRTLDIEDELFDQGIAYYLIQGADAQVTVEMSSSLSKIVATSSAAGGYLIGPWEVDDLAADANPLMAGAIRLPTASLLTRTRLDRSLQSGMVLDAANHPDIGFLFDSAKVTGRNPGDLPDSTVFELDMTGRAVFKGKAIPLEIEAELTLLLSSNGAMQKSMGDLARLVGSFELDAEQLSLMPRVAAQFGSTATVEFFLVFANVDPQRSIIPPSTPRAYTLENRYSESLNSRGDAASAYAAGEELIVAAWDDAAALRSFAMAAVSGAGQSRRFYGQAQRAAERAVALGGASPDPMALEVLAKVAAETGELKKAIGHLKKAIELATGPAARAKPSMEADLALYEGMLTARKK